VCPLQGIANAVAAVVEGMRRHAGEEWRVRLAVVVPGLRISLPPRVRREDLELDDLRAGGADLANKVRRLGAVVATAEDTLVG
jgi:hypothetical protein